MLTLKIALMVTLIHGGSTDWDPRPYGGRPRRDWELPNYATSITESLKKEKPVRVEPEPEPQFVPPPKPKVIEIHNTVDRLDREYEGTKFRNESRNNRQYNVRTDGGSYPEYRVKNYDEALDLLYGKFRPDSKVKGVTIEELDGETRVEYHRTKTGKWEKK
jgi:hypothetical protein